MTTAPIVGCNVCGAADLLDVVSRAALPGVTSDQRPHPTSGQLCVCDACGHVQRRQTPEWFAAITDIYAKYDMYRLSGGAEQLIFSADGPAPRSVSLVRRLVAEMRLPRRGKLLDVGCGKGAFLAAVAAELPGWALAGSELDDRSRNTVLAIPGVSRYYSGSVDAIDDKFDAISLMHVLEHIPRPVEFLTQLATKLKPRGILFAQVPFYIDNPFDLLVTDHASHFTPATMTHAGALAGLSVVRATADWVRKEVSLVLRNDAAVTSKSDADVDRGVVESGFDARRSAESRLAWVRDVRLHAEALARLRKLYVFGTSTAGSWLAGAMQPQSAGFVDEDTSRQGNEHLGLRVFAPSQLPAGSSVYVALPHPMATDVGSRLRASYPRIEWIQPPPMASQRSALATRRPMALAA